MKVENTTPMASLGHVLIVAIDGVFIIAFVCDHV